MKKITLLIIYLVSASLVFAQINNDEDSEWKIGLYSNDVKFNEIYIEINSINFPIDFRSDDECLKLEFTVVNNSENQIKILGNDSIAFVYLYELINLPDYAKYLYTDEIAELSNKNGDLRTFRWGTFPTKTIEKYISNGRNKKDRPGIKFVEINKSSSKTFHCYLPKEINENKISTHYVIHLDGFIDRDNFDFSKSDNYTIINNDHLNSLDTNKFRILKPLEILIKSRKFILYN